MGFGRGVAVEGEGAGEGGFKRETPGIMPEVSICWEEGFDTHRNTD